MTFTTGPARPPWLWVPAFAVVSILAGTTFTGCNAAKEPLASAKQLQEVQSQLMRIEGELAALRQAVPRETEQKLKDLEVRLGDPMRWPPDLPGAERIRQELSDIITALAPLAAERIMPQLARLNWGIEALWILRAHAHATANQLEEAQAAIHEVMDRQPRGHFPAIWTALESRLKQIEPQLRAFQLKQWLDRANRALEGKDDASAVFSALEEYRTEEAVATLLPKLRGKVLEKAGLERIEALEKKLTKTRTFSDDRTRNGALIELQDGVVRLIIELEFEESASPRVVKKAKDLLTQCDKELLALAAKHQEDQARKVRRYQAWALEQIRKFDSPKGWYFDATLEWFVAELRTFRDAMEDKEWPAFLVFPSLKDLIQEKVEVDLSGMKGAMLTAEKRREIYTKAAQTFGWKNSIDTEVAYRATRDGMVKFLLPIQPQLLDPPVAQLYQQAFAKGWQKLEGREDQLFVARQSAVVPKKTIDDTAASNP